jgi:hypothetical protein
MRKGVVLGLAIVLALGLVAAPAQGKTKRVRSTVEIDGYKYDGTTVDMFGGVTSPNLKCWKRRKVELRQITDDLFAGSGTTNSYGFWDIQFLAADIPAGEFQATVKKKTKKTKKGKLICKADTSPVFLP